MITTLERKERHQKLWNDKFQITCSKLSEQKIKTKINNFHFSLDRKIKSKGDTKITNTELKELLIQNDLYLGTFYIEPRLTSFNGLDLNLENVYMDLVNLQKTEHDDKDWAYDFNQFQKVYVIANNGEYSKVALTYKDSWCPFIFATVFNDTIYFEGNIGKSLFEDTILEK
jgi:hypothetical protein